MLKLQTLTKKKKKKKNGGELLQTWVRPFRYNTKNMTQKILN